MHQRHGQHLPHLTAESFSEAAVAVRAVAPRVLDALVERLREAIPELAPESRPCITNALPRVMEQLSAVMESGEAAVGRLDRESSRHAEHRNGQELDLDQMLLEYQLMRELLGTLVVVELGRELSPAESARLHAALDLSARQAAAVFVDQERAKLQSETASLAKYLSFLSHDLRGNLNGAMLMIEVLRRDLQNEPRFAESVGDLDAMRQSMLELVSTMDRFLQAERLRQGRVEVSLQSVDVGDFLQEQRRAMGRQVRGCEDQVTVTADPGLRVLTDREMLGLVVNNTLGNCVKYAAGGSVAMRAVALMSDGSDPAAPVCRIEVSDNGPGMDAELKERLFEPFVRGPDTGLPGTGLGLFIAKQAGDLLGARLDVESERGVGTTFVIDLPNMAFKPADKSPDASSRR